MKIRKVTANNHRRAFEIRVGNRLLAFPYAKLDPRPRRGARMKSARIDEELGREAFSYQLESGEEGSVHVDHVLEYNRDPRYMRDLLLYKLTLEAKRRVTRSRLSRRELIRRLGTSATQFYRLLDQTNSTKSVDQMLALLGILDCEVDLIVRDKAA